jgi:predicted phosphodiesterase
MTQYKTALVLPDIHVPYHDEDAIKLILKVAKDIKPDQIVQLGDLVDFYPISHYRKDPDRSSGTALQYELDCTKDLLATLSAIAPTTVLQGNHEERLAKYLVEKAPGLCGLRALTVPKLLGIDNKRSFYKAKGGVHLGKLLLLHGNEVSDRGVASSGGTCKKGVEKLNMSVGIGHIHRLGSFYVTSAGQGVQSGYEFGCLCQKDVEYMSFSNWQTGFGYVTYTDSGDKDFNVELVEIKEIRKGRRCVVRGKEYTTC